MRHLTSNTNTTQEKSKDDIIKHIHDVMRHLTTYTNSTHHTHHTHTDDIRRVQQMQKQHTDEIKSIQRTLRRTEPHRNNTPTSRNNTPTSRNNLPDRPYEPPPFLNALRKQARRDELNEQETLEKQREDDKIAASVRNVHAGDISLDGFDKSIAFEACIRALPLAPPTPPSRSIQPRQSTSLTSDKYEHEDSHADWTL